MPLPASKSQINKLGKRLAKGGDISTEDAAMLEELIVCHQEALEQARPRLSGLDDIVGGQLAITSRPKTTGTIIEKLRRSPTGPLANIQDLAGFRIVGAFSFSQQDELAREIVSRFPADPAEPDIRDRRADPSHGYRAVHVVVCVDGVNIEIQIRTLHQHMWANLMERLADRLGRQVRYGGAPVPPPGMTQKEAEDVVQAMLGVSDSWAAGEGPDMPGDLVPIIDELSDNVWKQLAGRLGNTEADL
jgi:ppGpp synthetase/RelA/SpoT-type nucleotidyltranferase